MSLPYSSSTPAEDPLKARRMLYAPARRSATYWNSTVKPRDIMTREAFENAIVLITDFRRLDQRRAAPDRDGAIRQRGAHYRRFPACQRPDAAAGRLQAQRHLRHGRPCTGVGGIPAVIKMLLDEGLLHGDCMTVTGKTVRENVKDLPGLASRTADRASLSRTRSSQPATSRFCEETWRPKARSRKSPAKRA